MLFNSAEFAIFFIITYGLYLVINHKWQNRMLLAASYIFYGSWDYRFLALMILSTLIGYQSALLIEKFKDNKLMRRLFLGLALSTDLSILLFFKYSNFFLENLSLMLHGLGFHTSLDTLNIILPVGISFYTFQSMSYVLDVYKKEIPAEKNLLDFALFISFFPQLVAGPIERAGHLLSQVKSKRQIISNHIYEGSYLIFWGLFQKIYVADNLGKIADVFFESSLPYEPLAVLTGVYAFAFQILCDFSGYSDMARGLAKLMGFELMINFNCPYFASNPREFWNRWHISLSRWFRDYVYIPLGGNKRGLGLTLRNLVITMLLAGLWHGARWTYIVWGLYHGFLLLTHRILEKFFQEKVWIQSPFFPKSGKPPKSFFSFISFASDGFF
jgi:alginate O-acetyltransferase complex protein AlgI